MSLVSFLFTCPSCGQRHGRATQCAPIAEVSLGPVVNEDGTPSDVTLRMFGRLPDREPEWVRRAREQRLVVRVEGGSARS